MTCKTAVAMAALLIQRTHHVHGVHDCTFPAFQPSSIWKYRRSPAVSSSRIKYSSDEVGLHNWLQPKHHASVIDDLHTTQSDDHFVTHKGDKNGENIDNIILDNFTHNADERRNRRLQSLKDFNEASAQQSIKRKAGVVKEHKGISSEVRARVPIENNLDLPYNDQSQLQAIKSNAPAILLPSGPGTGKSHVLSLRVAYLLQKYVHKKQNGAIFLAGETDVSGTLEDCTPDSMVILSFTNRDSERLKERALDYLFPKKQNHGDAEALRTETSQQLWSGTMHSFSLAVMHKYGSSSSPVKVLPARAMRNHVSLSLRTLLNSNDGEKPSKGLKRLQLLHRQALDDVGHSRSILHQNIVRCIDLWKEANLPLATVDGPECGKHLGEAEKQKKEVRVKKTCMELAMRLGMPKSSALLALDVYPEYQARHAAAGTADPSDLAGIAYRLLINDPKALHLLRSKLKHIIVDEYQDMSVSQHALLRLVVRGVVNEGDATATRKKRRHRRKVPVLLEPSDHKRRLKASSRSHSKFNRSYSVPSLFCAGDSSQSIYGWRGGSPELTMNGFRRDYPQGIIAPLGTCYRLPNDIVEAASMLLPMGLDESSYFDEEELEESYDVSPAAAAKLASSVTDESTLTNTVDEDSELTSRRRSAEENVRLGNRLLLSKGMQKLDSTVVIHGLWDYREEAKYIASTIRRRSKERREALSSALSDLENGASYPLLQDLTDVAIMIRSSNQLNMIVDALQDAGIPVDPDQSKDQSGETQNDLAQRRAKKTKTLPMKPVTIMTMHRSKGEEFDDVYLAGWTEGNFPHPEAVSSNRVHEERRLAYVALTRARQRVVITHSFMKRVLNYGRDGRKKYVTGQVQPSRFLYELVPSKKLEDGVQSEPVENGDLELTQPSDNKGTVWDRSAGVKEFVAGHNLPDFFQKTYQTPKGYVENRSELQQSTKIDVTPEVATASVKNNPKPNKVKQVEAVTQKTPLEVVEYGLKEIVVDKKKGASKKYTPIFKQMLASFFQVKRGHALVFSSGTKSKQTQNESVLALVMASGNDLEKKPLSRCTAIQLGHYLGYLILRDGNM